MDKFAEAYKATLTAFHGIISAWLFLTFSERTVDQFAFVILVIFFGVANTLVWKVLSLLWGHRTSVGVPSTDYRPSDVIGLLVISMMVGLFAAYVDREDIVLKAANVLGVDWGRSGSESPFSSMISDIVRHQTEGLDKREPEKVQAAAGGAYIRIYLKDIKLGYEGYPGRAPTKSEVRELVLTPACRFVLDPNDSSKISLMQPIEGPGVFLRLVDTAAIEIIDVHQSECANLSK